MFDNSTAEPLDPRLNWRCVSPTKALPLRGWLAGPTVGVWCHHAGVSTPCWSRLTCGVILCPHCNAKSKTRLIGYMPVWLRPSCSQRVIVISRTFLSAMQNTPFASPVRVTAAVLRGMPHLVGPDDQADAGELAATRISGRQPQDIRPYLLHLWQVRELSDHFKT